jgi:hypothetical protein
VLDDAAPPGAGEHRLRDHAAAPLDDQRGVGQQPAGVASAPAGDGADQAQRRSGRARHARAELERRPVVTSGPERDEHRPVARRAGQHADITARGLEHHADRALQRRALQQDQLAPLALGKPREVGTGLRRRKRSCARFGKLARTDRERASRCTHLVRRHDAREHQRRRQRHGQRQQIVEPLDRGRDDQQRARGRRLGRGIERRVLLQDRALEPPQLPARLEPELARQLTPRHPVGLQRLGLARRAVEREHQLAA